MDNQVLVPRQLPSDNHEVISILESIHIPYKELNTSPRTHEVLLYKYTSAADDIAARIQTASIVILSICPLTAETLSQAPYLKCIVVHSVGVDHVDLEYCRKYNIQVMNCPECNNESVAEHAISLYFATRRNLVTLHNTLTDFDDDRPNEWKTKGSLNSKLRDATGAAPKTCRQEVAGIIGYGAIGKHIAKLCLALGMQVIVSARKDTTSPSQTSPIPTPPAPNGSPPPSETHRLPFTHVLRTSTVLFLAVPYSPYTKNLISTSELSTMRPDAVVVNICRGGIVDEDAMVAALSSRQIIGYGTDVFVREPAGSDADSVLLSNHARGLNLTLTSHLAWCSDTTIFNVQEKVRKNVRAFVEGAGGHVIVKRT